MCWRVQFADPADWRHYNISVQRQFQELDPLWLSECPEGENAFVDRVDITLGNSKDNIL